MPTQSEHLYKAKNNKLFAEKLSRDNVTSVGWILTILFYSALHYIEAYNAKYHCHFDSHKDRNKDIQANPVLLPISNNYLELSAFSWNARYRPSAYGERELQEALESHTAIAKLVCGLLGITV